MVSRRSKKLEIWDELKSARERLRRTEQLEVVYRERVRLLEQDIETLEARNRFSVDRQTRLTSENERLLLLLGLTRDFAALDTDRILATTIQKIPTILRARSVSVYLYDADRHTLVLKDKSHDRPIDPLVDLSQRSSSLMALAVRTRQTLVVSDVKRYEEPVDGVSVSFPNRDRYGTPSCIVAPIVDGSDLFGVINLADRVDGDAFDRADREAITHLARFMAVALRNAANVETLRRSSPLDPLTGIRNLRAFTEQLTVEIKRARRYEADLALIVLDFKNFGFVNANHGHPAGDSVLSQVGRMLRGSVRDVDLVGRLGEDDFAVLLPEQNLNGALVVARRLCERLNDEAFRVGSERISVAAQLGVVQLSGHADATAFLRAAEAALQDARRRGESIGVKT